MLPGDSEKVVHWTEKEMKVEADEVAKNPIRVYRLFRRVVRSFPRLLSRTWKELGKHEKIPQSGF